MLGIKNYLLALLLSGFLVPAFSVPRALAATSGTCSSGGTVAISSAEGHTFNVSDNVLLTRDDECTDDVTVSWGKRSEDVVATCADVTTWHAIGTTLPYNPETFWTYTVISWNASALDDGSDYCLRAVASEGTPSEGTPSIAGDVTGFSPSTYFYIVPDAVNNYVTSANEFEVWCGDGSGTGCASTTYTINAGDPVTNLNTEDLNPFPSPHFTLSGPDGNYQVEMHSTDNFGNVAGNVAFGAKLDNTAPTSAATAVDFRGPLSSTIIGTASDGTGSGVDSVTITLQRGSDSNYWDGDSWEVAATNLAATGTTSWSYDAGAVDFTEGISYTVTPTATGNLDQSTGGTPDSFVWDETAPTAGAPDISPVSGGFTNGNDFDIISAITETISGIASCSYSLNDGATYSAGVVVGSDCTATGVTAADGTAMTIKVKATDVAGNIGVAGLSTAKTADSVAPTSDMSPTGPMYEGAHTYFTSSTTFTATCDDGTGSGCDSVTYELDGGGTTTYTVPFTFAPVDGLHTFAFRSSDNVGNVETPDHSGDVYIDDTAPSSAATIASGYYGSGTLAPTTISGIAGDGVDGSGVASVTITVQRSSDSKYWDGDSWEVAATNLATSTSNSYATWTYMMAAPNFSSGITYTITPTATDNLGTAAAGTADSFVWDGTSPVVATPAITPSYTPLVIKYTNGNGFDIIAAITESGSGIASCEYSLNGLTYSAGVVVGSDCTATGVTAANGTAMTIKMRATDNVGNIGISGSRARTSDAALPTTNIDPGSPAYQNDENDFFLKSTNMISATCDDGTGSGCASISYTLDGGGTITYAVPFAAPPDEGAHTISMWSTDNVGNVSASGGGPFFVDNTAPVSAATITNGYYGPVAFGATTINGTASDGVDGSGVADVTITVQRSSDSNYWDGDSWEVGSTNLATSTSNSYAAWTYAMIAANFTEGVTYTVTPTATDNLGTSVAGTADSFVWDGTSPEVVAPTITPTYDSGVSKYTNGNDFDIISAITETGSGIASCAYSLNNGLTYSAGVVVGSDCTVTGVTAANELVMDIIVRSTDVAGNVGTSTEKNRISDTAPPTSDMSPTGPIYELDEDHTYFTSSTTFTAVCDDGTGSGCDSVTYELDGGGTTTYTVPFTFIPGDGARTFLFRSSDKVGNIETPDHGGTIYLDDTAPGSAATITNAFYGSTSFGATTINGTASDGSIDVGSGLDDVTITIRRSNDDKYWDGNSWEAGATNLATSTSNSYATWTYDLDTVNFTNGVTYTVTPTATDNLGTFAAGTADSFVWDDVDPTSAATIVSNVSTISASTVNGTASDGSDSGLANVTITFKRSSDNKYWDGNSWEAGATNLATSTSNSYATWTYDARFVDYTNGVTYTITPTATDNGGNVSAGTADTFTISIAMANGIDVDSIQVIKSYATADDSYANGFEWRFHVTITDMNETLLAMKFAQWINGENLLNAGGNMKYSIDNLTFTSITANETYGNNIDVSGVDEDLGTDGRQVTLYVQMKVPAGTAGGSYSTSYGVRSL